MLLLALRVVENSLTLFDDLSVECNLIDPRVSRCNKTPIRINYFIRKTHLREYPEHFLDKMNVHNSELARHLSAGKRDIGPALKPFSHTLRARNV